MFKLFYLLKYIVYFYMTKMYKKVHSYDPWVFFFFFFSKSIAHTYERLRLFLERRPAESKRRERRLEYDSCVAGVVADVVVAFHRMSRGKLAAVPARLVRHDAFHSLFIKIIDRLILILDIYVGSQRLLKQKKEKEKNVGNALL